MWKINDFFGVSNTVRTFQYNQKYLKKVFIYFASQKCDTFKREFSPRKSDIFFLTNSQICIRKMKVDVVA